MCTLIVLAGPKYYNIHNKAWTAKFADLLIVTFIIICIFSVCSPVKIPLGCSSLSEQT